MENFYDLQLASTLRQAQGLNTSLKSACALGPSQRVLKNILTVAQAECTLLQRITSRQHCFQPVRRGSLRIDVCLN